MARSKEFQQNGDNDYIHREIYHEINNRRQIEQNIHKHSQTLINFDTTFVL